MYEKRPKIKAICLCLSALQALFFLNALLTSAAFAASERTNEENFERPRFISLSSDLVNMREGPSTAHSIKWIYQREGLPVQVLAEYDVWRRVRDMDGEVGWIHVSLLSNERTGVVVGNGYARLRSDEDMDAPVIAQVEVGAVGRVETCGPLSCRLDFSGIEGWVDRARFWGVYADEHF